MDLVELEIIWAEILLQVLDAALTVASMATGPEIAKLETGKTNAIDVGKEVTLRETAPTVLKS